MSPAVPFFQVFDINNAGQIVGDFVDAAVLGHGFLLSEGNFTTIDVPGSFQSFAGGVNNAGQIVGTFADDTGQHGFLATPVPEPGTLIFPGSEMTGYHGISMPATRIV